MDASKLLNNPEQLSRAAMEEEETKWIPCFYVPSPRKDNLTECIPFTNTSCFIVEDDLNCVETAKQDENENQDDEEEQDEEDEEVEDEVEQSNFSSFFWLGRNSNFIRMPYFSLDNQDHEREILDLFDFDFRRLISNRFNFEDNEWYDNDMGNYSINNSNFYRFKSPNDISGNILLPMVFNNYADYVEKNLKNNHGTSQNEEENCAICLDLLINEQIEGIQHILVHKTEQKNHTFHLSCFLGTRSHKCCVCRAVIVNKSLIYDNNQQSQSNSVNAGFIIQLRNFHLLKFVTDNLYKPDEDFLRKVANYWTDMENVDYESLGNNYNFQNSHLFKLISYVHTFDSVEKIASFFRSIICENITIHRELKYALFKSLTKNIDVVCAILNVNESNYKALLENENKSEIIYGLQSYLYYLDRRQDLTQSLFTKTSQVVKYARTVAVLCQFAKMSNIAENIENRFVNSGFYDDNLDYIWSLIKTGNTQKARKFVLERKLPLKSSNGLSIFNFVFVSEEHDLELMQCYKSHVKYFDESDVKKISNSFKTGVKKTLIDDEFKAFNLLIENVKTKRLKKILLTKAVTRFHEYAPFLKLLVRQFQLFPNYYRTMITGLKLIERILQTLFQTSQAKSNTNCRFFNEFLKISSFSYISKCREFCSILDIFEWKVYKKRIKLLAKKFRENLLYFFPFINVD